MPKLSWGRLGERYFETGVDRGVLYVVDKDGVPWNGLVSVTESPSGGDPKPYYLDGIKYLNRAVAEEFVATIQAFSSPPEFDVCDGNVAVFDGLFAMHQRRKSFGLSYRTKLGNDVNGSEYGYKLHLIYNALAAPSEQANNTLSDASAPIVFSWAITTTPSLISTHKPTAHLVIDSLAAGKILLARIEDILYGSDSSISRFPTPDELMTVFAEYAIFKVTLTGVDSYSAQGSAIQLVSPGTYVMDHESITDNGDGTLTIL